jgi:alpha-glucoside transport system substrate-binding protein
MLGTNSPFHEEDVKGGGQPKPERLAGRGTRLAPSKQPFSPDLGRDQGGGVMHHTRKWTTVAALATLALTTSSLGVAADSHMTGLAELDQAMAGELEGTSVNIQTQWIGGEGENFQTAWQPFVDATGIRVVVDQIGSSHETVLRSRVQGGSPPDMAMLAQPAAIQQYGAEGSLVDVNTFMPEGSLEGQSATLGLYSSGDSLWAIPYKVDVKGVAWYPIKAFEEKGYAIPQTWDELIALSDQIVADGGTPFCVGMGAGTATGWQATDLVEAAMLRTAGVEAYDQWVAGELPFDSPEVRGALDLVAQIYFTPGYVVGGNTAITALEQTTAMDPMFEGDTLTPGCYMHIIPFWYGPDFFPDQRTSGQPSQYVVGEDIGIFPLPPVDPAQNPALGAGDGVIVFNDRPEVRAFAQFLSTPEGIEGWVKLGSAIAANVNVPSEWYEGHYKSEVAAGLLANATDFRFDASDLMPAAVGAGSFWTGMVDWIAANGENTDQVLPAIDESWPR